MTADRAALVEKVARMFCSASEEECCNDTGIGCWYTYTAAAAIDLIRAEVLEEAARELDRRGFKELADTAIRDLKGDSNDV
jgi:hypothetical protein